MTDLDDRTLEALDAEFAAAPDPHRWIKKYPELGTGPISTDRFISEEFFERERKEVFAKSWLNVGSRHDFTGPNSFFVRDIKLLGVSLLVVQDENGKVQAFHNVCSHRGNKLIWEKDGACPKLFACRFHGWGYAHDGELKEVPDEEVFHFDKKDWGLVPVRTEVWNGFVFVNLDDDGTEDLHEYLGPLGEKLKDFPFDILSLFARFDVPERANWKVALDAQNEIYHVPMLAPLHRFLAGGAFSSNDEGYTRIHDFERLGRHSVYKSDSDDDFEETATGKVNSGVSPSFSELKLPLDVPFAFHVIFPNMVLAFFGNQLFTYNIWPEAVNQTTWEIRLHYPAATNLAEWALNEQAKNRFRDLLCEDQAGHEALQVGLESRARDSFVLGDQEIQIRAFHKNLDEQMERAENA
ncbi:aromatic ring-hydroxylating oxygenase subunit alpha [Geodermatophilus ruber]|uniref:Rieske [2Fe-2S] domain-containing protein n=1 Tax=Geodermatophilus ruber TaxID=504800 RepID=A0A1I4H4N7_9ACTN|nr:SRPBCC family protein [Geodermatophilus ruber]SFL36730.1 Rieske [2Fe-2S] domain-containing protein [Geodermatophilus ruber]